MKFGLNGVVKRVEARTISVYKENAEIKEKPESSEAWVFDESGNLIESVNTHPDVPSTKTINVFDSENRLTESRFYTNEELQNRLENSYNSAGQFIERRFYDTEGILQDSYCPIYTKDGWRIEESIHKPVIMEGKEVSGSISFPVGQEVNASFSTDSLYKSKEIFNPEGDLTEVSLYDAKDRIIGKAFVVYNENRLPVDITIYGEEVSIHSAETNFWRKIVASILLKLTFLFFRLKSFFRLIFRHESKKAFRSLIYKFPLTEIEIFYNERGNKIREVTSSSFNIILERTFKYDDKGNKTDELSPPFQEFHEYEYDSKDNWTKRKSIYKYPIDGVKDFIEREVITDRKIVYYDEATSA